MERFEKIYKDILPLGNLHILNSPNADEVLAIFFSLGAAGFNVFYKSESLQKLCEEYCKSISFKGILQVQYTLLLNIDKAFSAGPDSTKAILEKTLKNLEILEKNALVSNENLPLIKDFFKELISKNISIKTQDSSKNPKIIFNDFLKESLEILENCKNDLDKIVQIFPHLATSKPQEILQKAKNQNFTICITGILSAGKSTLLNALLGKEILGTSTIPETASLTLLSYSKTESAEITFWNTQEWSEVESILTDKTKALLNNQNFKDSTALYIKKESQTKNITLEELPTFTSANHPHKLCFLTKQTKLFTPLRFLENNITIVDTPGLDDPIIQREEITKNYLSKCDLLIHAMNASQSATQIDIDFILYSLKNANLARILIILTHADLLEEKDLSAALNYTKDSIKQRLKENLEAKEAELLLKRLDFLTLASYPALVCKTNPQKAKELGFNLEDSGFNALEGYLEKSLLGSDSSKAKDIIYLATQGFSRIFSDTKEALLLEKNLLFAKEGEIKEILEEQSKEKEAAQNELKETKELLEFIKSQLQVYLLTLKNELTQKLQTAQSILIDRIFSEILYDLQKGQNFSKTRLDSMLSLGLQDLLVEILRFNSQNLYKKTIQLKSQFSTSLQKLQNEQTKPKLANFNTDLDSTLIAKIKLMLLESIFKNLSSFSKNDTIKIKESLQNSFNLSFNTFLENLLKTCEILEKELLESFMQNLSEVESHLTNTLKLKEESLQNALKNLSQNKETKEVKLKELTQAIELIECGFSHFLDIKQFATN